MIEPLSAWWIILVVFIVNTALSVDKYTGEKNSKLLWIVLLLNGFIFYCMYVIKGAI
jgi:hypothetical protein